MDENVIKQYLQEISPKTNPRYKLLTREEEIELAKRIKKGDEEAKECLIVSNLLFVVSTAKKYSRSKDNLLDVINEGNIGLMEAAKKFDYRKGVKFSSYSVWWIKQKMFKYLEGKLDTIKIPGNGVKERNQLKKLHEEFSGKFGYEPTYKEFVDYASDYFNMDSEKTKFFLDLPCVSVSLNEKMKTFDGGECEFIDTIKDDSKHFTTKLEERCAKEIIRKKINELPKQVWKDVIKMRYGMFDESLREKYNLDKEKINELCMKDTDNFSLEAIGNFLGVTKERVRQIESAALYYMRKTFVKDPEVLEIRY